MDIVIHALGMPFNGDTIKTQSLGGSESAAYYQARELARRGHRVQVWTGHEEGGCFDGVLYTHVGAVTQAAPLGEQFTYYATRTPHDLLIIQRHPLAFHKDWASKINLWQMHDVATYRLYPVVQGGLGRVDFTTCVSQWHVDQVREVYGIQPQAIRAVPNGVDPGLYAGPFGQHPLIEKLRGDGKFVLLYQSRPERGLDNLLKPDGIMRRLLDSGSQAHLVLCGYDNTQPQMAAYYGQLMEWAGQLPNVSHLGCLTKVELAAVQRGCDLLVYPTAFSEVSCITAMEAMHAGLPMLTSNFAALAETCADSGTILVDLEGETPPAALDNLIAGNAQQSVDVQKFTDHIKGLEHDRTRLGRLAIRQIAAAERYTWAAATDRLLEVIEEAFARRNTPASVMRHLIEHSDIIVAEEFGRRHDAMTNVIDAAARIELATMYGFVAPDDDGSKLAKHYEYWEGKNCDRLTASMGSVAADIEVFMQTTRFRGVLQFVSRAIREATTLNLAEAESLAQAVVGETVDAGVQPRKVRVMEFGCAHGHVLIPLAKIFPDVEFVGVDFMQRSVAVATDAAAHLGLRNITFHQHTQHDLPAELGYFDCVIAAEVLEHVRDYKAAIYALRDRLDAKGVLVTTTPCGRWEWSGRANWQIGRQHLHHFECEDLLELFGPWGLKRHEDMLYSPADGHDGAGSQMGSWICYVQPQPLEPLGEIDLERKIAQLAPRQTVSLCMIVRDAEGTLRRVLDHVLPWVDQVIIGIDRQTVDDTHAIIDKLRGRYPNLPFDVFPIDSPMQTGFAAARNQTIDRACGDWILWMDADEEVPYAANVFRLLRPSSFNAYACPQIHYSAMPAQVLQTDYPCRLFRNKRGVRFYGYVHEHPEEKAGDAIAGSMLIGDVQFIHAGYLDDNVRRSRYQRNLPLLMRDVKENPDRYLNKYLLLRDIAQGLGFEAQLTGMMTDEMRARAQKGIETYRELMALKKPVVRMVVDALPFYSLCVELAGIPGAFDATIDLKAERVGSPTMANHSATKGRFADRETYTQFINLILQESTKHYDSKYA